MTVRPYQLMTAAWWRFSDYEVREGRVAPAPGATLEQYDPWKDYEASREYGVGRGPRPPYQAFISLVRYVDLNSPHLMKSGGEAALMAYCRAYGLPGLLLQQAQPLPAGRYVYPKILVVNGRRRALAPPVQAAYMWDQAYWRRYDEAPKFTRPELADLEQYFPGYEGLHGKWPDVPEPLSPAFWTAYCEPIGHVMREVLLIAAALTGLLNLDTATPYEIGPLEFAPGHGHDLELSRLNELTSSVGSVIEVHGEGQARRLSRRWTFRSLLACMAMMVQRDVLGGGRVYVCENKSCQSPFVSSSPKARYCGARCKNTAQKRNQRNNKRNPPQQGKGGAE